ncbi:MULTISPECIES: PP2C family protein-serine/threonine phosphatase [unclassified Serratia (in: enterobacteria)]|uniref:PP2C family protein-serine/threonine phosphatase n=1 Tax=unclassified Serratia (in: enterobacteria) TaxID=2647522 RepID=UPI002102F1C9|nr:MULTISPECIES: SpoIIE family protein phosphatase [unclassified Serratia (in: enterobacteria)]
MEPTDKDSAFSLTILIVDDSRSYRHLLGSMLSKWGYRVLEAQDGVHALAMLETQNINAVISDWEMPQMDGVALCRQIRQRDFGHYIYAILVTARQSIDDLVQGLESGADDFLSKPVNQSQLRARLHAAERVLTLESTLAVRNQRLSSAYQQIEQDLQAAARLQRSVLPSASLAFSSYQADWMFLPSAYVSGDLLNYFALDSRHLAFYCIDVAGHGVSAAMLSLAVAREFLTGRIDERLLIVDGNIVAPHQVVAALNRRFCLDNEEITSYFTLIYGFIDTQTGLGALCQAGHPTPFIIRQDGELRTVGLGGVPVGLFPQSEYQSSEFCLAPGERLYLYSDGISECENRAGELYGETRLQQLLIAQRRQPRSAVFQCVERELVSWSQPESDGLAEYGRFFNDDISLVAIERTA